MITFVLLRIFLRLQSRHLGEKIMKKCKCCGKPLTEFEISFHQEAGSPPSISEECWSCSGAEKQFMDGYTDKPHHRVEILVCLLAFALIAALLVPVFPYLNETELPESLAFYPYIIVIGYFAIGTLATFIIRRRGGKRPSVQESDPPMTRYKRTYGPDTDIYTTTVNRDGDLVTTKETRMGGSIDDRWEAHASSGSSRIDDISKFYGKMLSLFLTPCIYLLLGGTFAAWGVPYIFVMLARDKVAQGHNKIVPNPLQRAYRHCRKVYGVAPISYDDKVGFLVSREKHQAKKAESKNSFLSNYQQPSDDDSAPFFYTHRNGVSYMIIDYKREQNKNFGITFLLVNDGDDNLQKRIVVGNGFLPANDCDWKHEWNEAGISRYAMEHLEWYEQKMRKILKSIKKNSEIVG